MKSIDEVFKMCDSRYTLVTIVAKRAREIAEEAAKREKQLTEKPVNIVLDNLRSGKSTIAKPGSPASLYRDSDFEVSIMSDEDSTGNL